MIFENLVHFIGALLKHIIGVLLLCWRRMLRAGAISFGIGVVVTVLVGVIGAGQAIPSALVFIVALLFGLALAYGVALTVLVEELILGAVDLIRMLEGDIAAGAHITEVVAEREAGQVGQGLLRLFGLPVSKRGPSRPGETLPPLTREAAPARPVRASEAATVAAAGAIAAGAAAIAATRAATPAPVSTPATIPAPDSTPASVTEPEQTPAPTGEPVPADRLPRIAWTYEHEAIRLPAATSLPAAPAQAAQAEPATEPVEPVEPVESETEPATEPETVVYDAEPATPPFGTEPPPEAPPMTAPAAETDEPSVAETAEPAAGGRLHLPEGMLGAVTQIASGLAASHLMEALLAHGAGSPPEAAPQEAEYADERLAAPASVTTPEGPSEPAERVDTPSEDQAAESAASAQLEPQPEPASAPAATPMATEPADTQPTSTGAPGEPRADLARRTLPLGGAEPTSERAGVVSAPRASDPESGLWERLSSALINRSGAPSGPFAPAPSTNDEPSAQNTSEPTPGEQ